MSPEQISQWHTQLGMAINVLRTFDSQSSMLVKSYGLYSAYALWVKYQQDKGVVSDTNYQHYISTLINIKSNFRPSMIEPSDKFLADIARKCPSFELPFVKDTNQHKVKQIDDVMENNVISQALKSTERNNTHHKLRLQGYMMHLGHALSAIESIFIKLNPSHMSQDNGYVESINARFSHYPSDHPMWLLWAKICDYIMHNLVYADATDQSYAAAIGELLHFLEGYEDKLLKDKNNSSDQVLKGQINRLKEALSSAQSLLKHEFVNEGSVALLADIKSISTEATRQVQTVLSAFMLAPDKIYNSEISAWVYHYENGKTYERILDKIKDNKTAHANPMMQLIQDSQAVTNNGLNYRSFKDKYHYMIEADDVSQLTYNAKTPPVYGQDDHQIQAVLRHIIPLLDKMTCLTALLSTDKVVKDLEIDFTKVSAMVIEAKKEVGVINDYIQQVKSAYDKNNTSKSNSGFEAFSALGEAINKSFNLLDAKLSELKILMNKEGQDDQKNNTEKEYQDIFGAYEKSLDSIESRRNTRFYSISDTNDLGSHKAILETAKDALSFNYQGIELTKVFDSVGGKNNQGLDPTKINYSGIYATDDVIKAYHQNYSAENRNRASWHQFLNSAQGEEFRGKVFFVKTPKKAVELFTEVVSGQAMSQIMQHTNADQQTVIIADLVTIKEGLQGVIQPYDSVSQDLHKHLGTSKNKERYMPYEWWNPKVYETFILEKSKEAYTGLSEALFYPQLVYNYSNHSGNVAINTETKKFISRDQGAGLRDFGYLQSLMEEFNVQDPDNYSYFEQGQFDKLVSANGELHDSYLNKWSVVDRKEPLYGQMYKQVVRRYYQPINGLMMGVYAHPFSLNLNDDFKEAFIKKQAQLIQSITDNSEELCAKITQHTGISGLPDAGTYAKNLYKTIKHHARFMQLEFYRNLKMQNITVDDKKFTEIVQSGKDKDGYVATLLADYKKVLSIKQHLAESTQTSPVDKAKIYEVLQDKLRLKALLDDLKNESNLYARNIYQSHTGKQLTIKPPIEVLSVVTNKISIEKMFQATKASLCQKILDLNRFKEKASNVLDFDKKGLEDLLMVALAKRSNHYFSGKTTTTGAQIKALINADQGYRNLFKGCLGVTTNDAGDVTYVPYRALRDYATANAYDDMGAIEKHQALEEIFCLEYAKAKSQLEKIASNKANKIDLEINNSSTADSTNRSVNPSVETIEEYKNSSMDYDAKL